jgi:aminoglycoside phosphotransferase (APT) family kinase protein
MTIAENMAIDPQAGLAWETPVFCGPTPVWAVEPDAQAVIKVARRALDLTDEAECVVEFLGAGAFNKVFTVRCGSYTSYILRVGLPVHPHFKSMSEQATIQYVRQHTSVPIPQVLSAESSNNNELGFEWMVMERVMGDPLADQWLPLSWLKKELLVRNVIALNVQLFQKRFAAMGNLYTAKDLTQLPTANLSNTMLLGNEHSTDGTAFCLDEIVSMEFFTEKHLQVNVPRGPFKSSRDWLAARMQLHIYDVDHPPEPDSDDSDKNDDSPYAQMHTPEAMKRRAQRVLALLPQVFPETEPEQFVLHHHDLNSSNIMLNSENNLAGIIDWECVTTCPLWFACDIPKFLDDQPRQLLPNPGKWPIELQDDDTMDRDSMYYERLEEYEKTQMREFFLSEMRRQCPEWVQVYETSKLKRDFEDVVGYFGMGMLDRHIEAWLDDTEKGEATPGIRDPDVYEQDEWAPEPDWKLELADKRLAEASS